MTAALRRTLAPLIVVLFTVIHAGDARAHCDAIDGPVVRDATEALARQDVTPVLKWIRETDEQEVRDAFDRTLLVRANGPESRALADRFFFETVVRLHRASEGEPYTGLKPAGLDPGPAVRGADRALESGEVGELVGHLTAVVEAGLRERFEHARETLARAGESAEAGREHVAAYVEFVHFADRLLRDASSDAVHAHIGGTTETGHE